jgi:transcriptional regulator with XRE-family HTH domain
MQFLRGLREDNDKTQQDIANVLGISQTMYARYERCANELPIRHLIALCKYYNVSSDIVLGLTPKRNKMNPLLDSSDKK